MRLHTLKPAKGLVRKNKRIGRGQGSGRGGTSTKGHNGAQSRSGYSKQLGFEGGQMPLQRRVPKFGFTSPNRIEVKPVNLDRLQILLDNYKTKTINPDFLIEKGVIKKKDIVKILGDGELKTKVDITAHAFSKTAVEAIEKLGGKVTTIVI